MYEDEIDIHLNPRIGLDWRNGSAQKVVLTPGQNKKAYWAGTLDARNGEVLCGGGVLKCIFRRHLGRDSDLTWAHIPA